MICALRVTPTNNIDRHNEKWYISKVKSCRTWLTNHKGFNCTTRNVQYVLLNTSNNWFQYFPMHSNIYIIYTYYIATYSLPALRIIVTPGGVEDVLLGEQV